MARLVLTTGTADFHGSEGVQKIDLVQKEDNTAKETFAPPSSAHPCALSDLHHAAINLHPAGVCASTVRTLSIIVIVAIVLSVMGFTVGTVLCLCQRRRHRKQEAALRHGLEKKNVINRT